MLPPQQVSILFLAFGSSILKGSGQLLFGRQSTNRPFQNFGPQQQFNFGPQQQFNFNPNNRGFRQIRRAFSPYIPTFPGFRASPFANRQFVSNVSPARTSVQRLQFANVATLLAVAINMGLLGNNNAATTTADNQPVAEAGSDMEWNSWSSWTTCSRQECGFQERTRVCNGGSECVGNNKETTTCNEVNTCSFGGVWTNWGEWQSCVPLCNGGSRHRIRTCSNTNFECFGPTMDLQACPDDNPNRFQYVDRCYEVFNVVEGMRVNKIQAAEICKATRGAPADIVDQGHHELLIEEAKKSMTTSYRRVGFWLGMTADSSANIFLSSGMAAPYVKWAIDAPDSLCSCKDGAVLLAISSDGTRDGLNAISPLAPRRGVICEYDP